MLKLMKKSENGVIKIEKLTTITDEIFNETIKKFNVYKGNGVVLSGYDDMQWVLTNEKCKVHIDFGRRKNEIEGICRAKGIDYNNDIITPIKVVVVMLIGVRDLMLIRQIVKYVIDELITSNIGTLLIKPSDTSDGGMLAYYKDILPLLPCATKKYMKLCQNVLTDIVINNKGKGRASKHPCSLNEFQSYFKFDNIITLFVKEADDTNYQHYLPLIMFWKITTILPMRVTEFCVTPLDCLSHRSGKYWLTIRRSRLKGNSSAIPKVHHYKIDQDYTKHEYEIPKSIYDLVSDYIRLSSDYYHPSDLLLSVDYLLSLSRGHHTRNKEKVFGALELRELIENFYREVVVGRYRYDLVDEEILMTRYLDPEYGTYEMQDNEMMVIKAKHTRHLSMINLIYRGCNPMMVREFAGHAKEVTSANYYGNISKTVRCVTKMLYDRKKNIKGRQENGIKPDVEYNYLSILLDRKGPSIQVDGGLCYSKAFNMGKSDDCIKCAGQCPDCEYFWPDGSIDTKQLEDKNDKEMDYIIKMLKSDELANRLDEFNQRVYSLETDISNLATKIWKQEIAKEEVVWEEKQPTHQMN